MSASADRERNVGFTLEALDWPFEDDFDRERTVFLGEVDLTEIDKIRSQGWTRPHVSTIAFVIKAVALAVRDFPQANRRAFRAGFGPFGAPKMQSFTARDVAVSVDRDLPGVQASTLVEIIRSADLAALDQITAAVQALGRANAPTNPALRPSGSSIARLSRRLFGRRSMPPMIWAEQKGGAILVNSPPREAVDAVLGGSSHPIVVSFGVARSRPVVVEDMVVARSTFELSLTFERRILNGIEAARLFKRIVAILERPSREMDDFKVTADLAVSSPVAREPKRLAPNILTEPPPTRTEFPTIELYDNPENEKNRDVPRTRDDFTTIGDDFIEDR